MRIMMLSQSPERPSDTQNRPELKALLQSYASPGTVIDLCYPDDFEGASVFEEMGAQSILTGLHHAMATPALIRKIVWAEQNGYDAVIQSNTFDPGVEPGRLAVRIPVIGLLRAALHAATTLADRLALTVPLEGHVPYTWRILRSYGMQHFVADIRPIGIYGANLKARKDEIFTRTVGIMKEMLGATRAECIIPLGGALFPYVVSPADLELEVGVPVLNTKSIGIRFAETCIVLGMSHSPGTYPGANIRPEAFSATAASA
jgi:Asp/Glu/hydantoin racemase